GPFSVNFGSEISQLIVNNMAPAQTFRIRGENGGGALLPGFKKRELATRVFRRKIKSSIFRCRLYVTQAVRRSSPIMVSRENPSTDEVSNSLSMPFMKMTHWWSGVWIV